MVLIIFCDTKSICLYYVCFPRNIICKTKVHETPQSVKGNVEFTMQEHLLFAPKSLMKMAIPDVKNKLIMSRICSFVDGYYG